MIILTGFIFIININSAHANPLTNSPGENSIKAQSPFFVENKGQWGSEINFFSGRFCGSSDGINITVLNDGIVYDMFNIENKTKKSYTILSRKYNVEKNNFHRSGQIIKMELAGLSNKLNFTGAEPVNSYFNFFYGNNPENWQNNVQAYSKLIANDVYPGIDLILNLENGLPRYDFIIRSEANPETIGLNFKGSDKIKIGKDIIEIGSINGIIKNSNIYAFQEIGGTKVKIECGFVKQGNIVRFKVGQYDKSKPLVIDPIVFSTFWGGEGDDEITSIKLDGNGNLIAAGWTNSQFLRTTPGSYDTSYTGGKDIVVSKFFVKHDQRNLIFSTFIGGKTDDIAHGIALDPDGNIVVTGETNSPDFPLVTPFSQLPGGKKDAFLLKLNANGKALIFSTYFGGSEDDIAYAVDVGASGNIVITGGTYSKNLYVVAADIAKYTAGEDIFITRFNPNGTDVNFSTYFGASGDEFGTAVAVDESLNAIVIAAATTSDNLPTLPSGGFSGSRPFDYYYNGGYDGFLIKYTQNGGGRKFSTFYGGQKDDFINTVFIDIDGSIFFAGVTSSDVSAIKPTTQQSFFPITDGVSQTKFKGGTTDGFFAKCSSDGLNLLMSSYLGGSGDDAITGMVRNVQDGSMFMTGTTSSNNFPTVNSEGSITPSGQSAIFIANVSKLGALLYSTVIGSAKGDAGNSIDMDINEGIYVGGSTSSPAFPIINPGLQTTYGGGTKDGIILKYVLTDLNINEPVAASKFCQGSNCLIGWDAVGYNANETFNVQASPDNGTNWITIASDVTGKAYNWNINAGTFPASKNYVARVTNKSGQIAQTTGNFTIQRPPEITDFTNLFSDMNICEGSSVTFNVKANGDNLSYVWFKNGSAIIGQSNSYYVLDNITTNDAGNYEISVTNNCGTKKSGNPINLMVNEKTAVTTQPQSQTIEENKPVSFSVASKGVNLNYSWYKNEQKITSANQPDYTINSCSKADSGDYKCVISGLCGTDASTPAHLTIIPRTDVALNNDLQGLKIDINDNTLSNELYLNVWSESNQEYNITLLDIFGRQISQVFSGLFNHGNNAFILDKNPIPSGVYFIKIESSTNAMVRKVRIIK